VGQTLEQMRNQLNEFWQGLEKSKKIKLGVSSLLIVLSVTAIIFFTTRTNYEILYSNLTPKDTGLITKKLDDMGVKYKYGQSENTILVPSNMKNKVKTELASEGLPKKGYSFSDAINDSSWTMTDFEKKQLHKQALQSDLSNTLSEIDGIEKAEVYIEIPESSGFVLNDSKEATASVFLKLEGGYPLAQSKVTAVRNLVASSVGINYENVSVVDDAGKLLVENGESEQDYNISEQLDMQQGLQIRFNESVKRFLENIFGYGNVDVRTNVKVNFDSEVTNITQFSPPIEGSDEGIVRSMEQIEEQMVNGTEGGVPGTTSNTEDTTDYVQIDNQSSKFDKASKVINYEINEINKQIKKAPGQIESITVAILINKDAIADGQLTDQKRKEIEDLIFASTGLDTKQVQVNASSFNRNIATPTNQEEKGNNDNNTAIWTIALAMLAVAATSGFFLLRNKRKTKDYSIDEMIEQKSAQMANVAEIDFENEKSQIKAQINKFVDKKPEAVAQMLRTWINEE